MWGITKTSQNLRTLARISGGMESIEKDRLFKKSENKGGMTEDQMFVALGSKLDLFAKMLQLHPIDKDGKFKGKMKPISHDELKPVIMICPDAVECETMTCNPQSLLQMVQP